jgi:hypothetical protein
VVVGALAVTDTCWVEEAAGDEDAGRHCEYHGLE